MKRVAMVFAAGVLGIGMAVWGAGPERSEVGPEAMGHEIAPIKAPFYMPPMGRPKFGDCVVSITEFGAKADGKFNCRAAINRAIEACSKAGGGRVRVPAGQWFTGRIELRSGVELHLEKGAELHFSGELEDYLPAVFCRNECVEMYSTGAMIYALNQERIGVTGEGKIVGPPLDSPLRNLTSRPVIEKVIAYDSPVESRLFDGQEGRMHYKPYVISPVHCRDVFIESVSIERSAMWNIVPVYCERVIVRGVRIDSADIPTGDGVNIDSSRYVLVEYCCVNTGDDCYAVKAGRNEEGLRVGRSAENIVHRYNLSLGGHGGITCGSETAGMIRNLYVTNCRYENVGAGIRFKTRRPRGGGGENLMFENIAVTANRIIAWEMLGQPIYVGELAKRLPALELTPLTPVYRDIVIRSVSGRGHKSILKAEGIPEQPITNVIIEGCDLAGPQGLLMADAREIIFRNCRFACEDPLVLDLRNVQHLQAQRCRIGGGGPKRVRIAEAATKDVDLRELGFEEPSLGLTVEAVDGAAATVVRLAERH